MASRPAATGAIICCAALSAARFLNGRTLGLDKPFLYRLIPTVVQSYGDVYPELRERQAIISGLIEKEEERFENTIEAGIGRLDDIVSTLKTRGETQIAGEEVFRLYETYGFPRELTQDIASEAGLTLDEEGYTRAGRAAFGDFGRGGRRIRNERV